MKGTFLVYAVCTLSQLGKPLNTCISCLNSIHGVMVSVLSLTTVIVGLSHGRVKDYKIRICCFTA